MPHTIDIEDLPELDTPVAAYGVQEQREIGGEVCVNIAIAISAINFA